jgi:hypothetical protein
MNEKETKDKEQVLLHTITTEYTCSNSKQWINAENKHTIDRTLTKKSKWFSSLDPLSKR